MIHYNLTNEEYHLSDALSASGAKTIAMHSLAHFRYGERKPSTAFDIGTAVHTMVLEPHNGVNIWCGPENRRGNEWKLRQIEAEKAGALLLTEGDYQSAVKMTEAVLSNNEASRLLTPQLIAEPSVIVHDPKADIWLRCRPDGWRQDIAAIVDLKTTADPSPAGFAKACAQFGYHIQDQFYRHVMGIEGHDVDRFIFIAVGKEPPYAVGVYELDQASLNEGRAAVQYAIEQYAIALRTNKWGYGYEQLQTIQIPRWAFTFTAI